MLSAAQTDALGSVGAGHFGVLRGVCIGHDAQAAGGIHLRGGKRRRRMVEGEERLGPNGVQQYPPGETERAGEEAERDLTAAPPAKLEYICLYETGKCSA